MNIWLIKYTDHNVCIKNEEKILINDVLLTCIAISASLGAINPKKRILLVMLDIINRELSIQPDFCGNIVFINTNVKYKIAAWIDWSWRGEMFLVK